MNYGDDTAIMLTSQEIRKAGKAARASLSKEERGEKSKMIVARLTESEWYRKAHTIMIYKALGAEVSLSELEKVAAADGKVLLYPLCVSKTEMIALAPGGEDAWVCGSYGITEPVREKSKEYAPEEIDLMVCPCTAFDEDCRRVGMGGGYYDRFLPKCENAHVVAVAFEAQKVESIPAEPWDQAMERVYTETSVYEHAGK